MWWWYGALVALMAWGVAAWIYELNDGLAATGMRDVVSWGMYIFTFAFFIGLSAGGLIMASSAEVFGIKALKPLSRLGVLSAAACVAVAAIMVIPDLGKPFRIINIFVHPNWTSPLVWDILIITVYFLFSVVDLYVLQRHSAAPTVWKKRLRVMAYVGLPTAVLLHSVTAWIFGLQIARSWWNTSLMAPLFVVSAILSGTALVTLLALCAERFGKVELRDDTRRWLRGFIVVSLFIDLFFVGADYITVLWGNVPADRSALNLVMPGGPWQWLFWVEWIVGGVIPLALLLVPRLRKLPGSLGLAAFLVIVGVYAFRIELVVLGFVNPLTQYPPGNAIGTYGSQASSFQLIGRYHPTWVEFGIVIGLAALFATIVTVGYQCLHVMATEREDGEALAGVQGGGTTPS
jgi:molybdopterin-containing oxidoreductase family membrane subunit